MGILIGFLFFVGLILFLTGLSSMNRLEAPLPTIQEPQFVVTSVKKKKLKKKKTPEEAFEAIKQRAILDAERGDKAARDWVMKYVFTDGDPVKPKTKSKTNSDIVKDAIDALRSFGFTKNDAVNKVTPLANETEYLKVEDLIRDSMR